MRTALFALLAIGIATVAGSALAVDVPPVGAGPVGISCGGTAGVGFAGGISTEDPGAAPIVTVSLPACTPIGP